MTRLIFKEVLRFFSLLFFPCSWEKISAQSKEMTWSDSSLWGPTLATKQKRTSFSIFTWKFTVVLIPLIQLYAPSYRLDACRTSTSAWWSHRQIGGTGESAVEHRRAESEGLKFDSTGNSEFFSSSHAHDKTKKHICFDVLKTSKFTIFLGNVPDPKELNFFTAWLEFLGFLFTQMTIFVEKINKTSKNCFKRLHWKFPQLLWLFVVSYSDILGTVLLSYLDVLERPERGSAWERRRFEFSSVSR